MIGIEFLVTGRLPEQIKEAEMMELGVVPVAESAGALRVSRVLIS